VAATVVYLDASALVKRYVAEPGSAEVRDFLPRATVLGTAAITRVEVAAALAKAMRIRLLSQEGATAALRAFEQDWEALERLQVSELMLTRAAHLAWEHGLRSYDATHLAAALVWHEVLGEPVTVATFDRQLWEAARTSGLAPWPAAPPRAPGPPAPR